MTTPQEPDPEIIPGTSRPIPVDPDTRPVPDPGTEPGPDPDVQPVPDPLPETSRADSVD